MLNPIEKLWPPRGSVKPVSTKFTNLVPVKELLQWRKVCELGGDKLYRPAEVAVKVTILDMKRPQTD